MLKIWGRRSSSNVQKVLWTCDELALPYERIDVGGSFGGLDTPQYRAINPNGLIPTIEDDGFILWEAHAIIRYLAGGDEQHRLLPPTLSRRERADMDRWMDWAMLSLGFSLRTLFMLLYKPGSTAPGAQDLARAGEQVAAAFTILDGHLQDTPFVGGAVFTVADIPAGISAHRWFRLPVLRPKLPALEAWYAAISSRQGFQDVCSIPVP